MGTIIAIVVPVVFGVAMLIGVILCIRKYRQKKKARGEQENYVENTRLDFTMNVPNVSPNNGDGQLQNLMPNHISYPEMPDKMKPEKQKSQIPIKVFQISMDRIETYTN